MIRPGYYQTNFRGLSWSEMIRLGGFFGFPIAIIFKIIGRKIRDYNWYPNLIEESICPKIEFSFPVLHYLQQRSEYLQAQGFKEIFCVKGNPKTVYKESKNDGGGIYLYKENVIAILLYIENTIGNPDITKKQGVVGLVSSSTDMKKSISTSNKYLSLDQHPDDEFAQVKSDDIGEILTKHMERISKWGFETHRFISDEEIIPYLNLAENFTAEWRITKGLYSYAGETINHE
jgi:hypothetical protein